VANIGKSIVFKGELSGDEDLIIDGQVEGRITLPNNEVTIGAAGRITAEIQGKSIIIIGKTAGNLTATERIDVQATGIVEGDIRSPRLQIQEGAVVNGKIDMSKSQAPVEKRETGAPQPNKAQEPAARKIA
jgi:cytoskeletal protein CcmA (bactofilin family)